MPRSNNGTTNNLYEKKKGGVKIRYPPGVVILNIYEITDHPFNYTLGKMLTLGIHHTGCQIGNREFSFTLEGIVITEPRPRMARCKLINSTVYATHASEEVIHFALSRLQYHYTANSYEPLTRNCNHFTAALIKMITGKRVPGWINRAPKMAGMLGTKFRLKPAAITAPPISWSVLLPALETLQKEDDATGGITNTPMHKQRQVITTTPRGSKVVKFLPPASPPASESRIASAKDAHTKLRSLTTTPNRTSGARISPKSEPHNTRFILRSNSEYEDFSVNPSPPSSPFLRRTQSTPAIDSEIPESWGNALSGLAGQTADDLYDEPLQSDSPHRLEKSPSATTKKTFLPTSADLQDEPNSELSKASRIVLLEQVSTS